MDLSSSFPFSGVPCPSLPSLVFQHLAHGDSSLGIPELHTSTTPHPRQEGEEERETMGGKEGRDPGELNPSQVQGQQFGILPFNPGTQVQRKHL